MRRTHGVCAINHNREGVGTGNVINETRNGYRSSSDQNSNHFSSGRNIRNIDREDLETGQVDGGAIDRSAVHFRNTSNSCVHPCITMGVQNRHRNTRNRLSDIALSSQSSPVHSTIEHRNSLGSDNARALNLELHSVVQNLRNQGLQTCHNQNSLSRPGELSSSTTDIGESTTSAESLASSPESPNYETDQATPTHSNNNGSINPNDADSTVKRFLDRHFGGLTANGRRYPTTMSQSWSSSQSSPPSQNFKQSLSMCAFPPAGEKVGQIALQNANGHATNLPRSKSDHLKTNGSLINQPFNGVVPQKPKLSHVGRAVRVAYKDVDEIMMNRRTNENHQHASTELRSSQPGRNLDNDRSFDTDVFDRASNVSSLTAAILDPGEIIVTKKQDELRKLRLSHLLNQPYAENEPSECRHLPRSFSDTSVDSSSASYCPGAVERSNVVLSSDAKYPTNINENFMQTDSSIRHGSRDHVHHSLSQSADADFSSQQRLPTSNPCSSVETGCRESQSNQSTARKEGGKRETSGRSVDNTMVHSWHAGVLNDSCDDLVTSKLNTLGRNVNRNFEKKTCGNKDVISMLFPQYKPSNRDVGNWTSVPSSEMRACASQLYSCETEECPAKRDKRKHMFKRHSTGCFPTKHEHGVTGPLRVKHSHERQQLQRPFESVSDRRRSSSRDRKSNRRQNVSYDRDNSLIMCENNKRQTEVLPPYLMHSAIPKDFSLLDRGLPGLGNDKLCQGQTKSEKRSRSGRNDGKSPLKKSGPESSKGNNSNRHKKSASICQASPFHAELEQVLEKQQSCRKAPSKSCRHLPEDVDRSKCAITQV